MVKTIIVTLLFMSLVGCAHQERGKEECPQVYPTFEEGEAGTVTK